MRNFEKGKVSIITPCFNGERFLDRYFDSICKQTYDKIELIIVNDELSSDNSEKKCYSWKSRVEARGYEFRYILQQTYKGLPGAINEGLPFVTGEFLIWPDCDDILMPTSIERRVDFLDRHPDYALVRSDYMAVKETEPDVIVGYGSDWADVINENIFENLIFDKTFLTPGCYMVRSSILFERIPSGEIYWENRGGQDWQLLLPCSYMNKAGYIDEPLYKYFIRRDSMSHQIDGDEYYSHKKRTLVHQEILNHVIKDFQLLSEDERADYLARIELKYTMKRLDLALRFNKSTDAKIEMQQMEHLNASPGACRRMLYHFCRTGVSDVMIKGYSILRSFPGHIIKKRV